MKDFTKYSNFEQYFLAQGGHYEKYREWFQSLSQYEKQGIQFLIDTETTFSAVLTGHDKYFPDDKETRDIYKITLTRGKKSYSFRFGQSIKNSGSVDRNHKIIDGELDRVRKAPTPYDVLACLTKSDPGTFSNFCDDFGCDFDSRKAEKIYFDVQKEFQELSKIFTETELEKMQEIA